MVVKVYISGISGNKEVKKRQQRVLMILDSKNIKYEVIDITEPGRENDKEFMQNNAKNNGATVSDPNPRSPLPPQLFNDEEYCGDYDQFDLANELDTLEQFVKVEAPPEDPVSQNEKTEALNGDVKTEKEGSQEKTIGDEKAESKEGTPLKEGTPAKDDLTKDGTPVKETSPGKEEDVSSVSKEIKRQSTEKESTPAEKLEKESSPEFKTKESTPEEDESVNENGTVSSREQSVDVEEKVETESKKENVSESLIESEKLAATE